MSTYFALVFTGGWCDFLVPNRWNEWMRLCCVYTSLCPVYHWNDWILDIIVFVVWMKSCGKIWFHFYTMVHFVSFDFCFHSFTFWMVTPTEWNADVIDRSISIVFLFFRLSIWLLHLSFRCQCLTINWDSKFNLVSSFSFCLSLFSISNATSNCITGHIGLMC